MAHLFITVLFLGMTVSSASAGSSVTLFRDGSVIERDAIALKGVIDLPLAAGLLAGSLRVTPAAGTVIQSVDTLPAPGGKNTPELDTLIEQKQRLEDRLQALATREEIFTAAAKSQSGKAPRKSKTNPDPLQTIRQGTDFAIAQLEAVYTARRKADQELKRIASRITAIRKKNPDSETRVRITVLQPRGKVTVRYATADIGWQPYYNLYLKSDGSAHLNLSARFGTQPAGYLVKVSGSSINDAHGSSPFVSATAENHALLADYPLQLSGEQYNDSIRFSYTGTLTNSGKDYLPPGESNLYRNGVYLGRFAFSGLSSGRNTVISTGI